MWWSAVGQAALWIPTRRNLRRGARPKFPRFARFRVSVPKIHQHCWSELSVVLTMVAEDSGPVVPPAPDAGAAEAAAEVAAMTGVNPAAIGRQRVGAGGGGGRQRDPTADEAVMGAAAEGIGGFEILDESGELVRGRFLQFLME